MDGPLLFARSRPQSSNTACQPKVTRVCFVLFGPNSSLTAWATLGSHPDNTLLAVPKHLFGDIWAHLLFCKWVTSGSHPLSSATRSPEVSHHCLKWPTSISCLGRDLICATKLHIMNTNFSHHLFPSKCSEYDRGFVL